MSEQIKRVICDRENCKHSSIHHSVEAGRCHVQGCICRGFVFGPVAQS